MDFSKNPDGKIFKVETNDFKVGTGEGDFMKMFQDPTTLGFKLFFINIASGSVSSSINLSNILQKGKSIIQESNTIDTFDTVNSSGLFGSITSPNSALYYLKSIGDEARMSMLMDFKSLLSKLNTDYPWYFQSISGLNEAWNRDYTKPKFKKELTIECLESIDLRITALMDLYRKIAFDWTNRRTILPDNLRKFDLSIKIYDMRNIKTEPDSSLGVTTEFNSNRYKVNKAFMGSDYSDTTQITFNLKHCEFLPDAAGDMLGTISNVDYSHAKQSIKISYENIEEDNIYRSLVALGNATSPYKIKDYLGKELEMIENYTALEDSQFGIFGSLIDDITQNVSAAAANLVKSKLSSLYIGNVYGFSPSTIAETARNKIVNAPANAIGNVIDDL